MADVELRAAGVATGMGHGQGAGLVLLLVDLAIDLVAGAAGTGHAAGAFTAVGASPLGHEAGDDAVKGQTVVEAILGQLHEVGDGVRGIGFEQLELDQACFSVHQGLGHGGASKIGV